MAWENLEAEIGELLSEQAPELGLFMSQLSIRDRVSRRKDVSALRLQRKLQSQKRASYGPDDRNRTYTVRSARRVYARGAVCSQRDDGRFLPLDR